MKDYIVSTKSGKIRGYERNGILEYLGIPFARPPKGELRFKRARAVTPWEGILDAKEYGSVPVQLNDGVIQGAEDCLTINIQRPLEGEKLPVFVWIYGGGYNIGRASDDLYNGAVFAREGILFVSFQYRLNVLGFYDFTTYPGCEDFESNCGLSDQILALQWIHENIAAFGGDPDRITIAGESAGGASVVNLMAAPKAKGLFSQAIAQSALPNCVMSHQVARRNIDIFLEKMGWTREDLPKLKTIDPYELQKAHAAMNDVQQYRNPGLFQPCPVQDDLLPVRPIDAIRQGSAKGVKLIIGTNLNEGTMFVHPEKTGFPNSWSMVAEMFEKNGHAEALPEIIRYYLDHSEDPFVDFATDYAFQMPALKVAQAQKEYGRVWMYRYEFISASGQKTGMKASHAFDLPCMFANKDFEFSRFLFDGEPEEVKDKIIRDMHTPWVDFIKTGEPDSAAWPLYTGYDSMVRIFDRNTRTEKLDRTGLMEVWKDLHFYEE